MRRLNCARTEEILHDYLFGEVDEREASAIAIHLAVCTDCRRLAEVWRHLPKAVRQADMPPPSRDLIHGLYSTEGTSRSARVIRLIPTTLGLGAIAAAAAIAFIVFAPLADRQPEQSVQPLAKHPAVLAQLSPGPLEPIICESEGETLEGGRRVVRLGPGMALYLSDDAVARLEDTSDRKTVFRLERGFAMAEVGAVGTDYRFIVATPSGEAEARGTVFAVEVSAARSERVRVIEGTVEVRGLASGGGAVVLLAGNELRQGDAGPSPVSGERAASDLAFLYGVQRDSGVVSGAKEPRVSAERGGKRAAAPAPSSSRATASVVREKVVSALKDGRFDEAATVVARQAAERPRDAVTLEVMLKLAEAYRRARRYSEAVDTYEQLIDDFPRSRSASNSLVVLGQMHYTFLSAPEKAVEYLEQYLARGTGGVLEEQARVGLIRSLHRAGADQKLIEAASEYLARHRGAAATAEVLRRRGGALAAVGQRSAATRDLEEVISNWPETAEAKRASRLLSKIGGGKN